MCTVAAAQSKRSEEAAYVTVVGGTGDVTRLIGDQVSELAAFSLEDSRLTPGDGVRTGPDTTAVLLFPGSDAVVYLAESSEVRIARSTTPDRGVGLVPILRQGRVSMIRKTGSTQWLAVAAQAQTGAAAAFMLSRDASLVAESFGDQVTFAVRQGAALYFAGTVPAAPMIDALGEPVDASGILVSRGERVAAGAPPTPEPEEAAGPVVPGQLGDDLWTFALAQGNRWLEDAEKGDFTPVRGAARGAPQPLAPELEPELAFDQPRPVIATSAPRLAVTALRTTLSPAQTLAESDVPATAVAGSRFRRTRIIGPGTSLSGGIRINPAARSFIELRRR